MVYSAVIVAAGSGTRMKLGYNKVYAKLGKTKTILETTMQVFMDDEECKEIVVVTDIEEYRKHIVMDFWPGKLLVVKGGKTRQESVINGLSAVKEELVMIHDGARPFLSKDNLQDLKEAMREAYAACLAVPVKDTIKVTEEGWITSTPDRATLYAAQTPQVFHTDMLLQCMKRAVHDGFTGTDDSSVFERYSKHPVKIVGGSYANIKITTPEDLHIQLPQ